MTAWPASAQRGLDLCAYGYRLLIGEPLGVPTLVPDLEQVVTGEVLIGSIAPQLPPCDLVQDLCESFRQAICQSLCHDVVVVVPLQLSKASF